jgi:hypothetical protein
MRCVYLVSLAAGLAGVAAAASAAEEPRYTYCTAEIAGKPEIPGQWNTTYPAFYSGILEFAGKADVSATQRQFAASVGAARADCDHFYNSGTRLADARDNLASHLAKYAAWHVDTGWTGGNTPLASAPPPPPVKAVAKTDRPAAPDKSASTDKPATPFIAVTDKDSGKTLNLSPEVAARNQAAAEQYERQMAAHAKAQAEHTRKLAQHAENTRIAAAAKQEHERQLALNAAQVAANEAAQLEHRKAAAKPAGVNSVYRGFNGPTCEMARISAVRGSGTDQGSQFKEVTFVLSDNGRQCIVQGWSWTTSKTGSSRQ